MVKSRDARVPPRLRVAPEWRPGRDPDTGRLLASGRLWDFTEKIASSRREGKNRRDGATVSTRVVALTDLLGRRLFDEAVRGDEQLRRRARAGKGGAPPPARLSEEEERSLSRSVEEQRRRRRLENRAHL